MSNPYIGWGIGWDKNDNACFKTEKEYIDHLKAIQSQVCEHCPQGSYTQGSEHTDQCIELQDAIEAAESKVNKE